MGKSKHRKWYDKNNSDDYDNHQADNFKQRREKRLRTITDKHEEVDKIYNEDEE